MPAKIKKNILFFFIISAFLLSFSLPILAQTVPIQEKEKVQTVEVKVPWTDPQTDITKINPGTYIRNFFVFGFSFIGFLAVVAIIYGGILYSIPGQTGKGKGYIQGAIIGIILLFSSYLILYVIDPDLVDLDIKIKEVGKIEEPPTGGEAFEQYLKSMEAEPPIPLTQQAMGDIAGIDMAVSEKIMAKSPKILNDLSNNFAFKPILQTLGSAPIANKIVITETTGSHGCAAGDICVSGANCGKSSHCSYRAVDIRIWNLEPNEQKSLMEHLSGQNCTDELFYNKFPEYCRNGGKTYSTGACLSHTDHIHYSIKDTLECTGNAF